MEIVPYIFFLFTIRGHIVTGDNVEIDMIMPLVEKLVQTEKFNVQLGNKYSGQTCKNKNLPDCYQQLVNVYESEFKTQILPKISSEMLEQMISYNILVLSLIDKWDANTVIDNNTVSIMGFSNSKAYCVIGFLKFLKIDINDMLKDYVFFSFFEKTINSGSNLRELVGSYFQSRMDNLKPRLLNSTTIQEILQKLPEKKNEINGFSEIFCSLEQYVDFKWLPADDLLWNDLFNSRLFNIFEVYGQVPMKDKVEKGPKDGWGSMGSAFRDQHLSIELNIEKFYTKMHTLSDTYIVQVLLRRVVYIVACALRSFWFDMHNEKFDPTSPSIADTLNAILTQLILFRNSMIILNSRSLNTLDDTRKSFTYEYNVVKFVIDRFNYLFSSDIVEEELSLSIDSLKTVMNNDYVQLYKIPDNLIQEIEVAEDIQKLGTTLYLQLININTAFVHLIEVKLNKWVTEESIV